MRNSIGQLEATSGQQLPPTVTVLSGSGTGAQHRYFRIPPDVGQLQRPKGTKAIDFQRSSQAVIVPGSLHDSGHFYTFAPGLSPDEVGVADLPDWLLELMGKPTASIQRPNGTDITDDIDELFDELLRMGPPPGSKPPGRLRPDAVVKNKMKTVPMRMYGDDRPHSDSHWAWTLAKYCSHHWDQFLRIWKDSSIRTLPETKCGRASYEAAILNRAFRDQRQQWTNFKPDVQY
ncbi:MAG: bifunctional DNA primase/polymerase [Bryobacterales bacterium]|nr:bifunctional DNA primase/polymerase [Bryobacterales bacterium]